MSITIQSLLTIITRSGDDNSCAICPFWTWRSREPNRVRRSVDHSVLIPVLRVPRNVRSLSRFPRQSNRCSVHMALINTKSLTNKTFILNDFFTTHDLDFLLLTETWLKPGEYSTFSELLPPGCSFFSTLRAAGRGGGLAAIFKERFRCRVIITNNYSSFEDCSCS